MNQFNSKKSLKKVQEEAFINAKTNKGRKSLDEEKKKTKVVSLYLSENDFHILKERAERARLNLSQYIIFTLFNEEN